MRASIRLSAFVLGAGLLASTPLAAQTVDGGAVFQRECATCHTGAPDTRTLVTQVQDGKFTLIYPPDQAQAPIRWPSPTWAQ